jgi:hypothetical protein
MYQRVLASFLVFAMAAGEIPLYAAGVSALGVVTQASRANLASANVSAGASVYDGDSLTTASDGILRVRAGAAQLYLPGQSSVKFHSISGGTLAQLIGGTLVFSSAKAAAMDIEIAQAHVRPAADQPTVAQISVITTRILEVHARRGALQFSYKDETESIPEGSNYRILLDPTDEEISSLVATPAFPDEKGPRKGRKRRKAFIIFWTGIAGFLLPLIIHEALESPDKP